jgi:hypothetical protein
MTASLDTLAEALGRARLAYDRRPDDERLYRRFLEAENAFLRARGIEMDAELARERARSAEIGRRLRNRTAFAAKLWEQVQPVRRARARQARIPLPDLFDTMVSA